MNGEMSDLQPQDFAQRRVSRLEVSKIVSEVVRLDVHVIFTIASSQFGSLY